MLAIAWLINKRAQTSCWPASLHSLHLSTQARLFFLLSLSSPLACDSSALPSKIVINTALFLSLSFCLSVCLSFTLSSPTLIITHSHLLLSYNFIVINKRTRTQKLALQTSKLSLEAGINSSVHLFNLATQSRFMSSPDPCNCFSLKARNFQGRIEWKKK